MPHAAARPSRRRKSKSALNVLKADHDEARKLFKQFEKFSKNEDTGGMQQVARVACGALRVHAQIEEEIFYPALREGADANDALDEADVEHSHIGAGRSSKGRKRETTCSKRASRSCPNTSSIMPPRKRRRSSPKRGRPSATSSRSGSSFSPERKSWVPVRIQFPERPSTPGDPVLPETASGRHGNGVFRCTCHAGAPEADGHGR